MACSVSRSQTLSGEGDDRFAHGNVCSLSEMKTHNKGGMDVITSVKRDELPHLGGGRVAKIVDFFSQGWTQTTSQLRNYQMVFTNPAQGCEAQIRQSILRIS